MERRELLERLAPLIPPPRAHQVRYHGVLAPAASQRDWVVPGEANESRDAALATDQRSAPADPAPNSCARARRMRWASLLQRVFDVDALRCPRCGSTMRLLAAIEDPPVARKILECLKLSARAPPLDPAAADAPDLGQAQDDWLFDQSPAHEEP